MEIEMTLRIGLMGLTAALLTAACADPELDARLKVVEDKVAALDARGAAGGSAGAAAAAADPAKEEAAKKGFDEVNQMIQDLDIDGARAKIAQLEKDYSGTRAVSSLSRTKSELAIVGKDAGDLEVEKWFQGDAAMGDGKATMLVFWESWCPHCKREVPKLEAMYGKYKDQGLNIVGLTKVTRSSTDESVMSFIEEKGLTYPVAKEKEGNLSEQFGVRGVPAAAIVKDGKVIWRGHPARIDDAMIEKVL
jgi:thiol-disulfide isomerase/thioredoxin